METNGSHGFSGKESRANTADRQLSPTGPETRDIPKQKGFASTDRGVQGDLPGASPSESSDISADASHQASDGGIVGSRLANGPAGPSGASDKAQREGDWGDGAPENETHSSASANTGSWPENRTRTNDVDSGGETHEPSGGAGSTGSAATNDGQ